MKIHEYQAKALLSQYGIPVPRGGVAYIPAEAKEITTELGAKVVIKAQIYAGGRSKAGGIKMVNNPGEAETAASKPIEVAMLGYREERSTLVGAEV